MTPLVDFVLATSTIDKTLLKEKTWKVLTAIELNDKVSLRTVRNPIDTGAKENEGWAHMKVIIVEIRHSAESSLWERRQSTSNGMSNGSHTP